jgi:hypothetical protein
MRRFVVSAIAVALMLTACGPDSGAGSQGDANEGAVTGSGGASASGSLADKQPAGQAVASVDDLEYTFTNPGGVACTVADDEFSFSFIIGDNDVVIGGGGILGDDGWFTSPDLRIADPGGESGPVSYFPDPARAEVAVDGSSVSISGPFQKQPPNDGSNPPPVDVGEGFFSFTCP